MNEELSRTALLVGDDAIKTLQNATVAIFGIGGVGSFAADALARSGIGHIVLIDNDTVSLSNINRQLIALHSTFGKPKVSVMAERIHDINPFTVVDEKKLFFDKNTRQDFDFSAFSYIVDAIDTVSSKILIIETAYAQHISIVSSMGTGNKLDPSRLTLTDIYKTSVCPLSRVMRHELKKRNIPSLQVIYSDEIPLIPKQKLFNELGNKQIPGSMAFVPPVAGMIAASAVINGLLH